MQNIIEIRNLTKSFGDIRAVRDLSFSVRRGELFAFLGVNGAGKSTTISIMCGLLEKDRGSISICGTDTEKNMQSLKRRIGVVFQNSALDQALSVRDNLSVRAALYGIRGKEFARRLDELAELLDFGGLLGRAAGSTLRARFFTAPKFSSSTSRPRGLILRQGICFGMSLPG